jgi:predicted sulfurtransferase
VIGLEMAAAFSILLFYSYNDISALKEHQAWQRDLCTSLGLMGRIRVSKEGLNGTLSGSKEAITEYTKKIEALGIFPGIEWKLSCSPNHVFKDLRILDRKYLVNLGADVDVKSTGTHLSPLQFHEKILESFEDENIVLIDVRNNYESNIGNFSNAILPPIRQFSDFPQYFDELIEAKDLKKKKVLTYCTGGIRCETATAYLREKGVQDIYQLHGGIHMYLEQYPDGGLFQGKNFVFDDRITAASTDETVIGRCIHCDCSWDDYSKNMSCPVCGILVLVCDSCSLVDSASNDHTCQGCRVVSI